MNIFYGRLVLKLNRYSSKIFKNRNWTCVPATGRFLQKRRFFVTGTLYGAKIKIDIIFLWTDEKNYDFQHTYFPSMVSSSALIPARKARKTRSEGLFVGKFFAYYVRQWHS